MQTGSTSLYYIQLEWKSIECHAQSQIHNRFSWTQNTDRLARLVCQWEDEAITRLGENFKSDHLDHLAVFRVPGLLNERRVHLLPLPLLRIESLVTLTHENLALLLVTVETLSRDGMKQLRRPLKPNITRSSHNDFTRTNSNRYNHVRTGLYLKCWLPFMPWHLKRITGALSSLVDASKQTSRLAGRMSWCQDNCNFCEF